MLLLARPLTDVETLIRGPRSEPTTTLSTEAHVENLSSMGLKMSPLGYPNIWVKRKGRLFIKV